MTLMRGTRTIAQYMGAVAKGRLSNLMEQVRRSTGRSAKSALGVRSAPRAGLQCVISDK